MFINKIPFFMTISRNIRFATSEFLKNQASTTIMASIKQVKRIYSLRGFRITAMVMDGQFENLRGALADMQIALNTASNDEHVPEIERHIRTTKERVRSVYNTLPFTKLPPRLIIEMVSATTFWWNSFPPEGGVSDTLSPRAIVVGMEVDYVKHCQLEFGTYVQTHEEHDNSMASRTTGALAMRPTGNDQGGYYFFSLNTGRIINRKRWTALPMPNEVIDRVHALARRSGIGCGLVFGDRAGLPFDEVDDESFDPDNEDSDDETLYFDDDDDTADRNDNNVAPIAGVGPEPIAADPANNDHNNGPAEDNGSENNSNDNNVEDHPVNDSDDDDSDYIPTSDNEDDTSENENNDIPQDDNGIDSGSDRNNDQYDEDVHQAAMDQAAIDQQMDETYGERTDAYNLRPRRPRDYGHLHSLQHLYRMKPKRPQDYEGHSFLTHAALIGTMMTQYNMKQGIRLYGQAGVDAVLKELAQLHDRKEIVPSDAARLTKKQKKDALAYLMFLKKKRCGKIKGRGCADGRKQRIYTAKEEASSPTVSVEALMLTCAIDAKEERDVATVDIPGAFMQADMDELVHVRLEGTMAELLMKLDPKLYRPYLVTENNKKVLYVELKKALYGTIRAALLFWKLLTSKLEEWGFKINPYDWCVANKDINDKQCTIVWHVDDLKISHSDPEVVSDIISLLEGQFGKEGPLTVRRGRVHEYLGMTLDYSTKGKVEIKMVDYIDGMLAELPPDMDGEAATPASSHLFDVNVDNPVALCKEKADFFHHNVAKLLFLCKRARPDIQTAVAFLCTRVKEPDVDDYKKLSRVMKYLRATGNMALTIQADNMHVVKWWVDASFAVHRDLKSHTGGMMTL